MTIQEAKEKLVTWANAQIGTRESNNNYNRYAAIAESMRMYGWNVQNQPWCDIFVDAGFVECFGLEGAAKLTYQPLGGFSAACRYSAQFYKNAIKTPGPGPSRPRPATRSFCTSTAGSTTRAS